MQLAQQLYLEKNHQDPCSFIRIVKSAFPPSGAGFLVYIETALGKNEKASVEYKLKFLILEGEFPTAALDLLVRKQKVLWDPEVHILS